MIEAPFYPRHLPGQALWLPAPALGEQSLRAFRDRHRWMMRHGPTPKYVDELIRHSLFLLRNAASPFSVGGSIRTVNGSDEYISVGTPSITAHPSAHSIWFNRDSEDGSDQNAWYIGDKDAVSPRLAMWIKDDASPNRVTYFLDGNEGGVVQVHTSVNGWTAGQWHHAGSRSASVSDHSSYLDGDTANKGTATDTRTPNNYDTTSVGKFLDSTPSHPFDGMLAEVGHWSADHGEQGVVSLSKGFAPPLIDLANLAFYIPLFRPDTGTTWRDKVGLLALAETNTPTVDEHPPIAYPSSPYFAGVPAGGTTYTVSLAGTITPAGALTKEARKAVAGSITPTGAATKATTKSAFTGSITPTGAAAMQAAKLLAGSITPTGAVVAKTTSKLLAGTVTPAGAVTKTVAKLVAGAITPTGTVATAVVKTISLAGSITPTGTVTKLASKLLAGAVTPAGAVTKSVAKTLAGTITPAGTVARLVSKLFGGTVTPAGDLSTSVADAPAPGSVAFTEATPTVAFTESTPSVAFTETEVGTVEFTETVVPS